MVKNLEKYLIGLNDCQSNALKECAEFVINGKEDGFLIKGYAGTGKTFMLKRFIEFMEDNYKHRKIAMTAPTNKAVKVIESSVGQKESKSIFDDGRIFGTIHSLLKLKQVVDYKGNRTFKNTGKLDFKFKILGVDEVSMLNDPIFFSIDKLVQESGVKVIYLGDPAQIPPVGQEDSIPLNKSEMYKIKTVELTEIMRQKKDNKILKYYSLLRNNLDKDVPIQNKETALSEDGLEGIEFVGKEMNLEIIEKYVLDSRYIEDSAFFKILAWRNVTINKINNRVRSLVFEDEAENRFNVGEKIVANKPIFDNINDKNSFVKTSSELTVKSVVISEIQISNPIKKNKEFLKFHLLTVVDEDGKILDCNVKVIHKDSEDDFKRMSNSIKNKAIREKSAKIWKDYYDFLKYSADVAYAYALTVHKSW